MTAATKKALFACACFSAIGAFGWIVYGSAQSLPLLGFYAILILNTFFSIRTLSSITPQHVVQILFDAVLVCTYIALALSFSSALMFAGFSAGLFLISIGKYARLNTITNYPKLLRRKMKINTLGALLSLSALVIADAGYSLFAEWLLFTLFALANIYLLGIKPMYRLDY
jgi:hypothetical protein